MTKILACGSPKGGVGKTTQAVHLARIAADQDLKVLLVDADDNHSAADWCDNSPAMTHLDLTTATGDDSEHLAQLRRMNRWDLVVVDLPGAREGAFRAMLAGADSQPVPDLLLIPTKPRLIDIRPVARVIATEIAPLHLPYLLTLTQVPTSSLHLAHERAQQLRDTGLTVTDHIIRAYTAYDEAHERGQTVMDLGGEKHPTARTAEAEQHALATHVLTQLELN